MPATKSHVCVLASLSGALCGAVWGIAPATAQPAGSRQQASARPTASVSTPAPVAAPAPGGAAEGATAAGSLVLLFPTNGRVLGMQNEALLDQASRLYREGNPIIMVVAGGTDSVGSPERNLLLSQQRANSTVRGMIARGIPADRIQILAKGETHPALPTPRGVPELQNRRVEITWR